MSGGCVTTVATAVAHVAAAGVDAAAVGATAIRTIALLFLRLLFHIVVFVTTAWSATLPHVYIIPSAAIRTIALLINQRQLIDQNDTG